MNLRLEHHRKWLCLLAAALCAVVLVYNNGVRLDKGVETLMEPRLLSADEGRTIAGTWRMWRMNTIDFEKSIHTGFFYDTALITGALLAPVLGNSPRTFGIAARVNALVQGGAAIVLATAAVGMVAGWSLWILLVPLFLVFNPHFNYLSGAARVDISMWLWLTLVPWAYTRFLLHPDRRNYKWAMVLTTLAFAAKPSVLLLYPFFVGLNAWQVLRDRQPFLRELWWRLGKGLKYFLATLLLASPVNFFSLGLFVTSLQNEFTKTSRKWDFRPWSDWFDFLLNPAYLGGGLLLVCGAALAVAAVLLWMARNEFPEKTRREPDMLLTFLGINLLWTLFFWGFVILRSRSFIDRYLDPGLLSFIFVLAALAAWLWRQRPPGWPWLGRLAAAACAVVLLVSLPANTRSLQAAKRSALAKDRILAPHRQFRREFEALLPPEARVLISAYANVGLERYPNSHRFWNPQRYHFDIVPEYLLITRRRLDSVKGFLDFQDMSYWRHVIRKASAIIFDEIDKSRLFGTLELVKRWDVPETYLYRFSRPTDEAYVNWLYEKIYRRVGAPEPQQRRRRAAPSAESAR